jgi:hypothetical protein
MPRPRISLGIGILIPVPFLKGTGLFLASLARLKTTITENETSIAGLASGNKNFVKKERLEFGFNGC